MLRPYMGELMKGVVSAVAGRFVVPHCATKPKDAYLNEEKVGLDEENACKAQ